MTESKEHLEHLHQYITYRLRKLVNKQNQLKSEINHLIEYRRFIDNLLKDEQHD